MRISSVFVVAASIAALFSQAAMAVDRPVLLVTPQGAWRLDITAGVPQNPIQLEVTVIVQGFGDGGGGTNPIPPIPDPTISTAVEKVAAASTILKDKSEAIAVAALFNSLSKAGLTGEQLKQAVVVAAPIVDSQLKSGDRVKTLVGAIVKITTDPAVVIAGLSKQWGISPDILGAIDASATGRKLSATEFDAAEAFDFAAILQIIMAIIQLLRDLGILK